MQQLFTTHATLFLLRVHFGQGLGEFVRRQQEEPRPLLRAPLPHLAPPGDSHEIQMVLWKGREAGRQLLPLPKRRQAEPEGSISGVGPFHRLKDA